MSKPLGGRGKKAPYETTHVRVPVDLKPQIEEIIDSYRNGDTIDISKYLNDDDDKFDRLMDRLANYLYKREAVVMLKDDGTSDQSILDAQHDQIEESIKLAKRLIETRITKKELATRLLTAIYNIDVIL
jgi:hypothetical protein